MWQVCSDIQHDFSSHPVHVRYQPWPIRKWKQREPYHKPYPQRGRRCQNLHDQQSPESLAETKREVYKDLVVSQLMKMSFGGTQGLIKQHLNS